MEREQLVAYCLVKPGAEEPCPRGEAELVAKVGGKAFAFTDLDGGTVDSRAAGTPGRRRVAEPLPGR